MDRPNCVEMECRAPLPPVQQRLACLCSCPSMCSAPAKLRGDASRLLQHKVSQCVVARHLGHNGGWEEGMGVCKKRHAG